MEHAAIVLLEFYPSWLALEREVRRQKAGELYGIIAKYPKVRVEFFDAEALPGKDFTDFVICKTEDLQQYHYMWEEIRDTGMYSGGYLKIKDVIWGFRNAHADYESDVLGMEKTER